MENEQYRPSMIAFICSIMPIGFAVGLVAFSSAFFSEKGVGFLGLLKPLMLCCTAPLIALVMVSMGIYSVISGVAAIRNPEARGKPLAGVAIVLGILEIVAGFGFLFYLLSGRFLYSFLTF